MKIKGIKKAIGDYQRANSQGYYSQSYGILMYDTETGEIWTDTFYSFGHDSYRIYDNKAIINLGKYMGDLDLAINMANVKEVLEDKDFLKRYQEYLNRY